MTALNTIRDCIDALLHPSARYDALTRILTVVPTTWRFFVKHRIFEATGDRVAQADGGAADVLSAYEALAAKFADLPAAPDPLPC